MKKLLYILTVLIIFACDSEDANDCWQKSGDIINREVETEPFTKILVNENIEMILKEGPGQKIVVETGENLLNDIVVEVIEGELILTNNNSCNYVRDYTSTKIYVTAPNITEIRSSTQFDISSDGVLTYPDLIIYSEDFREAYQTTGNFYLEINNESFRLVFNNLSNCFISGSTNNLNINFAAGNCRFEGENLLAGTINVYHRGSNDIIVHPVESITGNLYGTGDLILVNQPETVEVEQHYKGKIIYQN